DARIGTFKVWTMRLAPRPIAKVTVRARKAEGGLDTKLLLHLPGSADPEPLQIDHAVLHTVTWELSNARPKPPELTLEARSGAVFVDAVTVHYLGKGERAQTDTRIPDTVFTRLERAVRSLDQKCRNFDDELRQD